MNTSDEKAPKKVYLNVLPGAAGDRLEDYVLINPLIAPDPVEYTKVSELRATIERVAKAHDELATKYPNSPDRVKAETLRRFAEVFL